MAYEAAVENQPKKSGRHRKRRSDEPRTVEVELGGRKVQIRQRTIPNGIGYGVGRWFKRLLG